MRVFDDPSALAAFGAYRYLEGVTAPALAEDRYWAQRISEAVCRGSVTVSVDRALIEATSLQDGAVAALSAAWHDGISAFRDASPGHGVRLHVDIADRELGPDALERLAGAEGVASVALVARGLRGPARWGWPLRIGVAGGEAAQALAEYAHPQLIEVDADLARGARYDVLILASALELEKAAVQDVGAGFLLKFATSDEPLLADTLHSCNARIRFRAGALVRQPGELRTCIHAFLDVLAHNAPPDEAIHAAIGDARELVVVGDPAFLDCARVSAVTAALEAELEQNYALGRFEPAAFQRALSAITRLPKITGPAWLSEGAAATDSMFTLANLRSALPAAPRGEAMPTLGNRHLQAQVFEASGVGYVPRTRSFEAGARHEVRVRIGPTDLDWISVKTPFPDKELAGSERRLTVRLVPPLPIPEPEQQDIRLGVTGASTVVRFEVDVPADLQPFQATITVFHEGKHVQTGALSGPVTRGQPLGSGAGIVFKRGVPSAAEPGHQRMFDLTVWKDGPQLLLEEYRPGELSGAVGHIRRQPSLQGIDRRLDGIREYLFDAARRIDQLSAGLEGAGLPMIQALAEHGEYLRRKLFGGDAMDHVRRVQVVSPSSSDFFPIEFLYDYGQPNVGAALCPAFKQHNGQGCSEDCPARAGNPAYVCPSGFWALNRVIERQVRPRDHADCHQPESSAGRPELMPLDGIVFAASDAVNEGDPGAVAQTVADIGRFAPVYRAASWSAWQRQVADHYPSLLVALPHNVRTGGFPALQIAADQELSVNRIRRAHVVPDDATVGSMILLLGCNTANATIEYEDFVNEFRCYGASLVIGTLTYVLGPQAAQVARELVAQIWSVGDTAPIGEIMREVRRRMLVNDNPMALAIAAFGDADWRFRPGV